MDKVPQIMTFRVSEGDSEGDIVDVYLSTQNGRNPIKYRIKEIVGKSEFVECVDERFGYQEDVVESGD